MNTKVYRFTLFYEEEKKRKKKIKKKHKLRLKRGNKFIRESASKSDLWKEISK